MTSTQAYPSRDAQLEATVMAVIQNLMPESELAKVIGVQRRISQNLQNTGQKLSNQNAALESLIANLKVALKNNGELCYVRANLDEAFSILASLGMKAQE
ncbi:hypothetical protein CEUSTIGMA_g7274.t1 [Chlamydomonas eustigma]|uniref:Uncharacterized protein n=1 Tax=Chlamydomonas eustigma TaxID=1157962 RepID=A0A250X9T6_9CHLO|nr:hypothetical protein CEUSTIGMA_g7274.t1 [Chlamydomonas eustigma]|eukprot:GAX79834.1 hypothetical protein CEUSTIGMA_g7274.t1 [Chlamydomonas eustigma]